MGHNSGHRDGGREIPKKKGWMRRGERRRQEAAQTEQVVTQSIIVTFRTHHHEKQVTLNACATVRDLLKTCNHATNHGIRVNGIPASFRHVLNNGDIVEVR